MFFDGKIDTIENQGLIHIMLNGYVKIYKKNTKKLLLLFLRYSYVYIPVFSEFGDVKYDWAMQLPSFSIFAEGQEYNDIYPEVLMLGSLKTLWLPVFTEKDKVCDFLINSCDDKIIRMPAIQALKLARACSKLKGFVINPATDNVLLSLRQANFMFKFVDKDKLERGNK